MNVNEFQAASILDPGILQSSLREGALTGYWELLAYITSSQSPVIVPLPGYCKEVRLEDNLDLAYHPLLSNQSSLC